MNRMQGEDDGRESRAGNGEAAKDQRDQERGRGVQDDVDEVVAEGPFTRELVQDPER